MSHSSIAVSVNNMISYLPSDSVNYILSLTSAPLSPIVAFVCAYDARNKSNSEFFVFERRLITNTTTHLYELQIHRRSSIGNSRKNGRLTRTFLKIRTSIYRANNVILPILTRMILLHATFLVAFLSAKTNESYEKWFINASWTR